MKTPLTAAPGMPPFSISLEEQFARMFPKPTPEQIAAAKRVDPDEENEEEIDAAFGDDYDPDLDAPPLPEFYDGR